jgi:hypothetical protein
MRWAWLLASAVLLACGGQPPPSADRPVPRPPDLTGRRVLVLPAQASPAGGPVEGFDAELGFWLADQAPRVEWVLPPEIDRALARSPSLGVRPRALAVSVFHRAEVRNIGDPLFGDLRSLNALLDARYALVPTAAAYVRDAAGRGRVEVAAALIDTVGGRVLWFGVVAGQPGPEGGADVVASAAQELARTLAGRAP